MGLEKFKDDLQAKPPRMVSASKLDRNFKRCHPAKRGLLSLLALNEHDDGWFLDFPKPPEGTAVLGSVNGILKWIPTEDCEE